MKTIGIKLADGSFYPVIQEGSSEEINLSLTTANNNQTKVIVDLYRSKTNSMDDAEYVDSLQIENLNAHPDGEPDIALSVHLDENNQLHAKIVDSETGAQSNSTVTLVSRTLEERLNAEQEDNTAVAAMATGAAVAGVGLLAAAEALNNTTDEEEFNLGQNPLEENLADFDEQIPEEQEAPAFDEEISVDIPEDEAPVEETPVEETQIEESPVEENPVEETPDFDEITAGPTPDDFNFEETLSDSPSFDEPIAEETPDFAAEETPQNNTSTEKEFSENPLEAFGGESHITAEDSENLGDFFDNIDDNAEAPAAEDTIEEETSAEFDMPEENTELPDMNFDIPEENTELPDMDFDMPESPDFSSTDDGISDDDFFHINDEEPGPAAGGISFTGLYDKDNDFDDSEQDEEKSKTPVIICVVCAIICLIAVFLLLFILPTKYNLIQKKAKKAPEEPVAVVSTPELVETPKVEAIPEAKEDEVIIIEKAEEVVPLPPPVKEEKPGNITYKIKWGDTLWDISDTYYKNPWRYKYLARFNGIKDPDYIISGTYIIIPAE